VALFQTRYSLSDSKPKVRVKVNFTLEQTSKAQKGFVSDGLSRSRSSNCNSVQLGIAFATTSWTSV
jgi:hypothetical protein